MLGSVWLSAVVADLQRDARVAQGARNLLLSLAAFLVKIRLES